MDNTWTTYRMADGSLVFGEYAWVENEEFFEELDEPVKVVKETWVLQKTEMVVFEPPWWVEDDDDYVTTEKIRRKNGEDDLYREH